MAGVSFSSIPWGDMVRELCHRQGSTLAKEASWLPQGELYERQPRAVLLRRRDSCEPLAVSTQSIQMRVHASPVRGSRHQQYFRSAKTPRTQVLSTEAPLSTSLYSKFMQFVFGTYIGNLIPIKHALVSLGLFGFVNISHT